MDEVVGSAKVILEGIDKISPAVRTSLDTLKKWGDSGVDIQQKLMQAAQKQQQTIHALNQIYQQNQTAAKAAGATTGQGFQAGIQQVQQFTQAAGKVPPALMNITQVAAGMAKAMLGFAGPAGAVIAIEEFARKSYMAFTSQEEHMRRVQLAMGGSAEEIKKIHGELNDLAGKTGSTTEKMTDAFRDFMSRSGLGSGEVMQAFRGVVEAADEAGVSVHDMSRIATAAMAQLKVSTYDMPQLLGSMGKAFAGLGDDATKVMPNIINSMQRIGLEGKDNLQGALAIIEINKKKMGDAAGPAFQSEMRLLADPNSITGRLVDDQVKAAGEGARNTINEHMLFVDIERDILKRASGDWYRIAREEEYYFGTDQQLILMLRKDAEGKREDLLAEYQAEQKVLGGVKEIDEAHKKFMEGSIKETRALTQEFTNLMAAVGGFLDSIGATDTLHSTVEDLKNIKEFIEWVEGPQDEEDKKLPDQDPGSRMGRGLYNRMKKYLPPPGHSTPMMAEGGVVSEPTMTMIGEAGPEAVVPLTRGGDMRGSSGGTQAERDTAEMWGRLHGHAMTRTAHVDRHGPLTQEVIDKLMGGGGGGGTSGGGAGAITGGGGSSGGAGASGTTGDGTPATGDGATATGPSQVTAGGGKGRWPNIGNIKAATKDQLMKEGLTEAQAELGASGLVGQAIAESGLRSQFHDAGKRAGRAGGYVPSIYGADRTRGQRMIAWLKANNLDPNDTAAQGRWMAHEVMKGGYGRSVKAMRGGDLNVIADALTQEYEAPASRFSPGTLRERRRNAEAARGVETVTKMAKGAVVRKPTLAMVGESGPEAVVPLKDANEMGEGLGGGDADIGNYSYQASSPEQFDLHDLARRNEQVLRPGIKRARPSFTDVLRQNPQLGIPEGQAGGPGGTNLFGGSEFKELKAIERNLERPDEKQLKYGQELEQGGLGYYGGRGGWRKDLGGWDAAYGGSSGGAGASGSYPNFGGGFGGGQTPATEGYTPSVANVNPNALGFINAIGRTESDFSEREAYSDATNRMSYGSDTSQYDYGYYQMAQRDIDYAVKTLHMSPDIAQHLTGGPDHKSTYDQQTAAVNEYLQRGYPEAYKNLVEHDDYEGMRQATRRGNSWKWFGLKDKPKVALTEYNKTAHPAQTTAVTPLPKSRPAQASAQDHFNKNPIQVPVAPANLGAHRQSFARSSGWAQRKATARRATHEATVHSGEM